MQQLVLSAIGEDRSGLVDELTQKLLGLKVNIADSRMVNLAGQFALVMAIMVEDGTVDSFQSNLNEIAESMALKIQLSDAGADQLQSDGVPYRVMIYTMDQPGLVHKITHCLSEHKANIEELSTTLQASPHTGTPLFSMSLLMTLPVSSSLSAIRGDLEVLCDELNCDLDINPA